MIKEKLSRNQAINVSERAINADVPKIDNDTDLSMLGKIAFGAIEKIVVGIASLQEAFMPEEKRSRSEVELSGIPASEINESLNKDMGEAAQRHDPIRISHKAQL